MSEYIGKPGTALASLIPDWAVAVKKGCGCQNYQKKMDAWGADGCETRKQDIIDHLVRQRSKLTGPLKLLPDAGLRAMANTLVIRAIQMAKGE